MSRKAGIWLATISLGLLATVGRAEAGLFLPQSVVFVAEAKTSGCGIQADYELSGATLRVEVVAVREPEGISIAARAYQPNSVGPLMRDIWLKTPSLFTLGRFRPAAENGNGILEARGGLALQEGKAFLNELSDGAVEISIIFDGVMPTARLPVGLPSPLPDEVRRDLTRCLGV